MNLSLMKMHDLIGEKDKIYSLAKSTYFTSEDLGDIQDVAGVYVEDNKYSSAMRFQWIKAPTNKELSRLTHTIAKRIGRYLEQQGLLERGDEHSYLNASAIEDEQDPMHQLHGSSVTYRIAVGPRQGRKVFTLQTLPAIDADEWVGHVDGFSLHAGVAAKAHERKKLERICRYIARHRN